MSSAAPRQLVLRVRHTKRSARHAPSVHILPLDPTVHTLQSAQDLVNEALRTQSPALFTLLDTTRRRRRPDALPWEPDAGANQFRLDPRSYGFSEHGPGMIALMLEAPTHGRTDED